LEETSAPIVLAGCFLGMGSTNTTTQQHVFVIGGTGRTDVVVGPMLGSRVKSGVMFDDRLTLIHSRTANGTGRKGKGE
jgi:hypothetical protein